MNKVFYGWAFFPWWVFGWEFLTQSLSQKKKKENKTLLPSLKGFDMQKAAGTSAVSSIIASNNSASVMGILLTSYFV